MSSASLTFVSLTEESCSVTKRCTMPRVCALCCIMHVRSQEAVVADGFFQFQANKEEL